MKVKKLPTRFRLVYLTYFRQRFYTRVYVCVCMYVCMYMCVYMCVCVCVYAGQCCKISERQAAVASHLCTVVPVPVPVPTICRSTVWNMRHVVFLAPRNLRWLLDFWKLCELLTWLYVCISPTSQLHLSSLMYFPSPLIHPFQCFLQFCKRPYSASFTVAVRPLSEIFRLLWRKFFVLLRWISV